ncbi:hypothetical protein SAMN05444064_102127 [Pseudomonas syringae]|nr:hypothetical protein SAMN05444514_102282 [Pseudomonas syringae]SFL52093.1 hypothetical protein SAMN05444064_102127 [Pseudomonas syringae]
MLTPESDIGPTNDKGQSCEAVTYRKNRGFLQRENLTKHFSISPKARLTAVWRLIKPKMKIFTSRAFVASDVYCFTGVSSLRMDNAIRSAVPMGTSPTTVTIMSP